MLPLFELEIEPELLAGQLGLLEDGTDNLLLLGLDTGLALLSDVGSLAAVLEQPLLPPLPGVGLLFTNGMTDGVLDDGCLCGSF